MHAEQIGRSFRERIYQGNGLLRLHSTYRHDLKIYSGDEGRVLVSAAAFTKGLLDLEGFLTPILESLVRKGEEVDRMIHTTREGVHIQEKAKAELRVLLLSMTEAEVRRENLPVAVKSALATLDNRPREAMMELGRLIQSFALQLEKVVASLKKRTSGKEREEVEEVEGGSAAASLGLFNESKKDRGDGITSLVDMVHLAYARWDKLRVDFMKDDGGFDISKIPDIYDCAK